MTVTRALAWFVLNSLKRGVDTMATYVHKINDTHNMILTLINLQLLSSNAS